MCYSFGIEKCYGRNNGLYNAGKVKIKVEKSKENIIDYYNHYDEEGRLFRDYLHQIEYRTTMHYFERLLPQNSKVFDGCAGTGNYAFALAGKGHTVFAGDIVPHNVDIMLKKQEESRQLKEIHVADICNVKQYEDDFFDVVLCMGAFYHLDEAGRHKALQECLRILKGDGVLVVSYINLMAVIYLQLDARLENMEKILNGYHARSFDDAFTYMSPEEMESMAQEYGLEVLCHLTSDGNAYLHGSDVNRATEDNFNRFMELHLDTCENRFLLGSGLHGLIFLRNPQKVRQEDQGNELLANLKQLHTTKLGAERIRKNLSLDTQDTEEIVSWCKEKIKLPAASISRSGKNWYVTVDNCLITVNAYSYTIITAHKKK